MEGSLRHFQFAPFQFLLRALDTISLPAYKGSTLRGAFGHAFKKVVCVHPVRESREALNRAKTIPKSYPAVGQGGTISNGVDREKACGSCLLKGKCVYSYVFETPPPSDTSKMRKYPFAPHPFVITPPLEEKRIYRQNETFSFELTLIGKSIDYLPYFIYTFDELGKMGIGKGKGRYNLEDVGQRTKVKGEGLKDEEAILIYSGKDKTLRNNFRILKIDDLGPFDLSPSTLHFQFLTPTRLKFDGSLSPRPEFHILFRNLLRRISLLSYFHCGEELSLDFRGLIEKSREITVQKENLTWFDWERYSNRQNTKMKMGGFIGTITFGGDLEEFMPFLLLGKYIHVGKGTSFGLGKYEVQAAKKINPKS
jgi:CRISPR-associated endoribonuclease Cas6